MTILELLKGKRGANPHFLKRYKNELSGEDIKKIDYLIGKGFKTPAMILYAIENNLDELPKCKCGNELTFINAKKGFSDFCSVNCPFTIERQIISRKKTMKEKYGKENAFQIENFKEKAKKTRLEKYGAEYSTQKGSKTREKIMKTNLKKYGSVSPFGNEEIRNKIKSNHFNKSGFEHNKLYHLKNKENFTKEYILKNFLIDNELDRQKISEYYGINYWNTPNLIYSYFDITEPFKKNSTKTQKEIVEYIKSIYKGKIIVDDNKTIYPKELDIFIPEYNFAIEYDGILWHSFGKNYPRNFEKINPKNHLQKTLMCEDKNIHLFHIFENEWNDEVKKDIWKSKITIKLNAITKRYNARNGYFKEIDTKTAKNFLVENHLQGYVNSSFKIGFFIGEELLAVFTLGSNRFKNSGIELLRFASKKFIVIRGLFSKFLNYFKNNFNEDLISYGNRRWTFKNNVYNNDFEFIKETQPNYYYFNEERKLLNRLHFQKHKLKQKLKVFNDNLTEIENVINNGYRIIYDCGNLKYILRRNK